MKPKSFLIKLRAKTSSMPLSSILRLTKLIDNKQFREDPRSEVEEKDNKATILLLFLNLKHTVRNS